MTAPLRLGSAFLLSASLLAPGCGSGRAETVTDGLAGKLVMTGSSTCAPLVAELAQAFEALHPGVRIDVQTGGSSRGIRDASSGLAEIGMSSRNLKSEEEELVQGVTFAQDGVAFLVHAGNDGIPADGSVRMWLAMRRVGVHSELHVFPHGGHGYGLRPTDDPVTHWPKLAADWMKRMGYLDD